MRYGQNGTGKSCANSSDVVSKRHGRIRHVQPANSSESNSDENICIPTTDHNVPDVPMELNHNRNKIIETENVCNTFDVGTQTGSAQPIYGRDESMQKTDYFNLTTVSESGVVCLNSNEICDVVVSKPKRRVARKRTTIMPSVKIEYVEDISINFTGIIDLTLDD